MFYVKTFLHRQVPFDGFPVQWEAPIQAFEWLSPVEIPDTRKTSNAINILLHVNRTCLVPPENLPINETTENQNEDFEKEIPHTISDNRKLLSSTSQPLENCNVASWRLQIFLVPARFIFGGHLSVFLLLFVTFLLGLKCPNRRKL